jgi:ribonuclease P protein component
MLKKENRLSSVSLLNPITHFSPLFTLKVSNSSNDYPRFAFIVSKRLDKRAVARNELRRRFRSVIEENLESFGRNRDFVFYLKPGAIQAKREEILTEIGKIIKTI